jgi:hypothetical protein
LTIGASLSGVELPLYGVLRSSSAQSYESSAEEVSGKAMRSGIRPRTA